LAAGRWGLVAQFPAPLWGALLGRQPIRSAHLNSAHLNPARLNPGGFHPADTKWRNTRPDRLVEHIVPKSIPCRPRLYSRRHIDLLRVAGALCCS